MLLTLCDNLGREVLIWSSDLHGIANSEIGILLRFRCGCGEIAEMLTGAGSPGGVSIHLGGAAV